MKKLILKLQNSYGIKKLETEFDFSRKKTFAIYAPNGVMKTSFAKTFKDLSNNQDSKDLVFPERKTVRSIKDENDIDLLPKEVFVIEPYNEQFNSDKLSTLLVKKELKDKYDTIHQAIDKAKDDFFKKLKQLSGLTARTVNIQEEIEKSFKSNFFEVLEKLENHIDTTNNVEFSNIIYNEIFNDKVLDFLKTKNFKKQIKAYIEKYNEIIEKSTYLKKDFNHYHAITVQKNLTENGFFNAKHSVNLFDGSSKQEISDAIKFEQLIKQEKEKVLNNEDLQKEFEEIDKKLSNADLRKFRDYLFDNKDVLIKLEDIDSFQKELWISYFIDQKDLFVALTSEYKKGKVEIAKIIEEAKKEKTDWEKAVKDFNDRFKGLPFKLKIENKDDVILKTITPSIKFIFYDSGEEKNIERKDLLEVLSQGERRALYILNIIFEVEARKKLDQKTLFIVDDIADSFDYKNKYAIIEYLKDISEEESFYQIILTHNFDFYRSISGRIIGNSGTDRSFKLHVVKTKNEVKLIQEKYQNNPFSNWRDNLNNSEMLIASIPFVRNLAEYCGYKKQNKDDQDQEYEKLTSLLHVKSDTDSFIIQDLQEIFTKILKDKSDLQLNNSTKKVLDLIFELADKISQNTDEVIALENKIVLSIAIRLKAEIFMIKEINNQNFLNQITKNQTIELIKKFRELFPNEIENIEILEQVNLMTPENIHLNSFMYEPILDMSDEYLKSLYDLIKNK